MSAADDSAARERALDPSRSLIVEAPAGSGKTELLTQRLLCLLNGVERPEQVVAITFTRKAAAEMRQRVVESLRAATSDRHSLPPHRRRSVELARAVLARSARLDWSLLEQSQRLRILTIDALNAHLARQMPLLSGGILGGEVSDRGDAHYRTAARRTVARLAGGDETGRALGLLLGLADNSLARLEQWLAGALPQRDRWIRQLQSAAGADLPAAIEAALTRIRAAALADLRQRAGAQAERRLFGLVDGLHDGPHDGPHDGLQHGLRDGPQGGLPDGSRDASRTEPQAAARWQAAAALLLTQAGAWRQRFTRREGIAPGDKATRSGLTELIADLDARAGLRAALADYGRLPQTPLGGAERETLTALEPVLRHLLAELKIAFAEAGTVDHTEVALAAQQALGAVDEPSELLLALDRRIEHLLVDEFQDTSHLQWGLLERLTAGWQSGDGRTLFLVGDPMQSIYRFRDADLGLFLRAAREGIGGLALEPVRLGINYRSAGAIVDWVNGVFPAVFAAEGGSDSSAPAFTPAQAGRGEVQDAGVTVEILKTPDAQAELARVVALVRAAVERDPAQSIGVLVRSRTHLLGLRAALAAEHILAHAVEIDSLTDTAIGLDLLALTQALLHDGDRLSWLAVLRSPAVGLGWTDLHALVETAPERSLPELLGDPDRLARLSGEGRRRARWLMQRLERARRLRAALPLGRWLRACWLLLDGPAVLTNQAELALAERYFVDLDALAAGGDVDDPAELAGVFGRPSGGEVPGRSGVELMTIHRAKGLEFDTVVLPGIGKTTRGSESKLLILNDFIDEHGEALGLLAGPGTEADSLQSWLRRLARDAEAQERARLLYVAVTRARHRLHLVGAIGDESRDLPRAGSLLATLWPGLPAADTRPDQAPPAGGVAGVDAAVEQEPETEPPAARGAAARSTEFFEMPFERLVFDDEIPLPPDVVVPTPDEEGIRPEFEWVQPAAVQIGTLIHRELQRLAEQAAARAGAGRDSAEWRERTDAESAAGAGIDRQRYRRELALLGVEPEDIDSAAQRVAEAVSLALADPVGRWILEPRAEACSELRLSVRGPSRIEHLQIDRSFVDDAGLRWIIDYKTGRHLGADIEAFLDAEVERYRAQLERYAAVIAAIDPRPIRVGLYFPLLGRLRDWLPASARRD